jgi:integrase
MREEIPQDPFRNITNAPETHREKGILTPAEVSRLIAASERYPRTRLAVLLGLFCGMRRGEVRGLLWGDIGEGLKAPYESSRTVPIPGSVQLLLETVRAISGNPGALDFFIIPGVSLLRLIVIPYFFAGGGFLRRGNFPQRFYVFFQQLFFPAVYPACLPTAVFQLLSC